MPNASINTMPYIHKCCDDPFDVEHLDYLSVRYLNLMHIEGATWQDKLDTCNACNCCQRHQYNKPYKLEPYYSPMSSDHTGLDRDCKCCCRHYARVICDFAHFHLLASSPDPCDLPAPPLKWTTQPHTEKDYDLSLLDIGTAEALDHYWKGQVKACQYAIFHIC